jgi:glycerol-3-phosphate dehydrogenase
VLYPEYQTDDARLVLDTLKSAHHAGAVVVNYVRVTGLGVARTPRIITVHDEEGDATFDVRARTVVNASGPWVDDVRRLDGPDGLPSLHLTKGIHVVFRTTDLPARHCVVMRAEDGRPVFVVPRGDHVYVGTTDTNYTGPLDEPAIAADDVAYLQRALARTFSGINVAPERAIGAWAGVRPLVQEPGKKPSEISRKDEIVVSSTGLVTIAGGKLTAYRRMAERVVETVAPLIGRALSARRAPIRLCPAATFRRPRPRDVRRAPSGAFRVGGHPPEMAARLIATYGSDAIEVAARRTVRTRSRWSHRTFRSRSPKCSTPSGTRWR